MQNYMKMEILNFANKMVSFYKKTELSYLKFYI